MLAQNVLFRLGRDTEYVLNANDCIDSGTWGQVIVFVLMSLMTLMNAKQILHFECDSRLCAVRNFHQTIVNSRKLARFYIRQKCVGKFKRNCSSQPKLKFTQKWILCATIANCTKRWLHSDSPPLLFRPWNLHRTIPQYYVLIDNLSILTAAIAVHTHHFARTSMCVWVRVRVFVRVANSISSSRWRCGSVSREM